MSDDDWTERLWQWAEENGIDDNVLPRNKKRLTKLTTLDLSRYKLIELPKEIANLTNLTSLSVYDKYTKEWGSDLSEIRNLSDFTRFYIESGVTLHKLPKEITNLTNLTTVHLYGKKNRLLKKITKDDLCMIAKINKNPRYYFEVLSKHKDQDVRSAVAGNSSTSAEVLKELANDKAEEVRSWVANNSHTPVESLIKLSREKDDDTRRNATVKLPESSKEFVRLSKDKSEYVRQSVAMKTNSPEILKSLAKDESDLVRGDVALNRDTSSEVLKDLAKDVDELVRADVAQNPNATEAALLLLATDKEEIVRIRVAQNKKVSMKVTKVLAQDKSRSVRDTAIEDRKFSNKIKESLRLLKPKKIKSIVNYYELIDDKSAKFWEIEQKGSAVHLRWGKIGTKGQSKIKELDSSDDAKNEAEKLIRQKTRKGYTKADPAPVYQEDKDKIKASVVNLRKKLSRYKTYCKNNKVEIKDEVKKNIESVELLCKAANKGSLNADLYQETEYDFEYLPNRVIEALDSANIAWKPVTERCKEIEDVKRDGDMIGCFPWTSESYPWPNKAAPGIQVDLRRMSKLNGENLGDGLLQVWFDAEYEPSDPTEIRIIPRNIVENEIPDVRFVDFIPSNYLSLAPGCGDEIDFPGWIITDYKMIGIQADPFSPMEEVIEYAAMEEVDTPWGSIYGLMEDLNVNETSFFGVPYPLQTVWSEFYEEGQRNLLSLNSKEYFCVGFDDTGQLMYKKGKNGEIWFSYYWSHS